MKMLETIFNILDKFHQNRIIRCLKNYKITKVIDVGAHKGEFLSYILKLNYVKKIYCFEPQIKPYHILFNNFRTKKNRFF